MRHPKSTKVDKVNNLSQGTKTKILKVGTPTWNGKEHTTVITVSIDKVTCEFSGTAIDQTDSKRKAADRLIEFLESQFLPKSLPKPAINLSSNSLVPKNQNKESSLKEMVSTPSNERILAEALHKLPETTKSAIIGICKPIFFAKSFSNCLTLHFFSK